MTAVDPPRVFTGEHGEYEVLELLGEGAVGVTYRARRRSDDARFVVKELKLERVAEWKSVELFEREIATLASLDHPGIPKLVDTVVDREASRFALVQTEVPGRTLAELLRAGESVELEQLRRWLRGGLELLAYLHARVPPVVHRDINPANIMVHGDALALIDFGAVKVALRESTTMTSVGTFGYMAPEHIRARAEPASDMFGLGMSFIALATGCEPGELPVDRQTGQIDAGSVLTLPEPVRGVLLEMTAPGLGQRLGDAEEALARLTKEPASAAPELSGPPHPHELDMARLGPGVTRAAPKLAATAAAAKPRIARSTRWLSWRRARAGLGIAAGLTLVGGWIASTIPAGGEIEIFGGWFSGHGSVLGGVQATLLGDIYGVPRAYVGAVAFDASGEKVVTAAYDETRVWSTSGETLARLPGADDRWSTPEWVGFSPEGGAVIVGDHEGTFDVLDVEDGLARRTVSSRTLARAKLELHSTRLLDACVGWFPNAEVAEGPELRAALWGERPEGPGRWSMHLLVVSFALSGAGERVLLHEEIDWRQVDDGALALDGRRVVFAGGGAVGTPGARQAEPKFIWTARVFDLDEGAELFSTQRENHDIRRVALDGRGRVVTLSYHGLSWWSLDSGARLQHHALTNLSYETELVVSARDELALLNEREIEIFGVDGERIAEFRGHRIRTLSAAFDPSGAVLLTGGADERAKLWALP